MDYQQPTIAPSAQKHGLHKADIMHAYRNPIRVWDLGDGFTMIVGTGPSANLLGIGFVEGDRGRVIVHAMPARERFLR